MSVPYGLLALLGVRPARHRERPRPQPDLPVLDPHRGDPRLGRLERVLNTPSHHRVHHGSNRQYLDRNHGSILIVWDKLFGTFEREDERVVYGLTRNIDTYNPVPIATHEWRDIARDVAGADDVARAVVLPAARPGWAYDRRPSPVRAAWGS